MCDAPPFSNHVRAVTAICAPEREIGLFICHSGMREPP